MTKPSQDLIDGWERAEREVAAYVAAGKDPLELLLLKPGEVHDIRSHELGGYLARLPFRVREWLATCIQERVNRLVAEAAPHAEQGAAALAWVPVAERLPDGYVDVAVWVGKSFEKAHILPSEAEYPFWVTEEGFVFPPNIIQWWCAITQPVARPAAEQAAG